jgi:glycosyltransferase involved in cell wall biosynthesis
VAVIDAVDQGTLRVSVVIPCLNEAENIERCVQEAQATLEDSGLAGEVIVVDNGSDDASAELARGAGAIVVDEPRRGYGSAYRAGFAAARGDYIVMIDADLTYDFSQIPRFVEELDRGAALAMGNRMENIDSGAMPWLNRYVGNPILSGFLNVLFRTKVHDAHCGMRAVRRDVLPRLDLHATGMEFASEMVIRATRANLEIREFPIALHARSGQSKLSPFRDGWRHLRLMLLYNPNFLFLLPGALMAVAGALVMTLVFVHASLFGHTFFVHTLIAGALLVIIGVQLVGFGLCARTYAVFQLGDRDRLLEWLQTRVRLEHGLAVGAALGIGGLALGGVIVGRWVDRGLGSLSEERVAILAATLLIAGVQVFSTAFLLSIIGLRKRGT